MTRDDYIEPDPRDTEAEAIECEDAADQAIVDRRETMDDPALRGDWLYPGEYQRRPTTLPRTSAPSMAQAVVHALDSVYDAQHGPRDDAAALHVLWQPPATRVVSPMLRVARLAADLVAEAEGQGIEVTRAEAHACRMICIYATDRAMTPALAVALGLTTRRVHPGDPEIGGLEFFEGTRDGIHIYTHGPIHESGPVYDAVMSGELR